ncbi:MAG: HlyD family efflux transporter periplasmic adaptor subunit [Oscillospiraceae bacterium]|nr:HlyD family efflux transporter periplasmic adaptor subunit [Oscillospiraceae bacterium]
MKNEACGTGVMEEDDILEYPVQDNTDAEAEKSTGPLRRLTTTWFLGPLRRLGRWLWRHKALTIGLAAVLLAGIFFLFSRFAAGAGAQSSYSFIRTTTLQRTTLQDSVSTTGTVQSANVSTVTTTLNYSVTGVHVQVGDQVASGDVIAVLDTSDLEDQIERKQNNITKQEEQLAKSNEQLYQTYTDAKDNYQSALDEQAEAQDSYDAAYSKYKNARDAYRAARNNITSFQSEADSAEASMLKALEDYNDQKEKVDAAYSKISQAENDLSAAKSAVSQAKTALSQAQYDAKTAEAEASDDPTSSTKQLAYQRATQAVSDAEDNLSRAQSGLDNAQATYDQISQTITNSDRALASLKTVYDNAVSAYESAQKAYATAQSQTNYTSLQQEYEQAQSSVDSAESTLTRAQESTSSAKKTMDRAYESYEEGSSSSALDDLREELTDLQQSLSDCTLVAETAGTVTSLNATVGSSCQGTVATIQDTESLKIAITLEEYDVINVSKGMTALITSDATTKEISGTVTQIDPTSTGGAAASSTSSSSTFGAEVTVQGGSNGLLIGMNANVEIIQSSTEDVFVVPYDAVGTQEDGSQYVYVKTGGEGVNMTFEKVTVTTGESNDYYVEITGDKLNEGDVIRSTADLTVGIETVSDTVASDGANTGNQAAAGMGGMNFGGMGGGRADAAGGAPAGGNMPGGGM